MLVVSGRDQSLLFERSGQSRRTSVGPGGYGTKLALVGDFDGDGFADLLVEWERRYGRLGRSALKVVSLRDARVIAYWVLRLGSSGAYAIGNAGDFNGDGLGDVYVSDQDFYTQDRDRGRLRVYSGAPCAGTFQLVGQGGIHPSGEEVRLELFSGCPTLSTDLEFGVTSDLQLGQAFVLAGFSNTWWNALSLPFDLGVLGAPGNTVRVSADVSLGERYVVLSIPNDPLFVGNSLYFQGVVPSTANSLGLLLSNSLEVTIR